MSQRATEEHELVWALSGDLDRDGSIAAHLAQLDARLAARKRNVTRARQWALAASVAIIAICAGVYSTTLRQAEYVTQIGEQRMIELRDQSQIQLNTDSIIRVRYTPWSRVIEIDRGEAVFTVMKDTRRPFLVRAGDGDVRAVGTQFGVWRSDARVRVTVLEGVVAVKGAPSTTAVELRAGSTVDYDATGTLSQIGQFDERRVRAWMEGRIEFRRERLDLVLSEFSRYSKVPLALSDPSLAPLEVTGVFRVGAVEALLSSLESAFGLEVKRTPKQILIAPMPAKARVSPVVT